MKRPIVPSAFCVHKRLETLRAIEDSLQLQEQAERMAPTEERSKDQILPRSFHVYEERELQMKRVLIVLPNGFEMFEAAAFIDVLGWANEFGVEPIEAVSAGVSDRLRCTFGNVSIVPDVVLSDVNARDFDAVAIPGGFEQAGYYEDAYLPRVSELFQNFAESSKPIASICVGALPVAKSGVLNGRSATTYGLMDGRRREQLASFGARVLDDLVVEDTNIITSSSPGTAVDVALRLVAAITTSENAAAIRHLMGF